MTVSSCYQGALGLYRSNTITISQPKRVTKTTGQHLGSGFASSPSSDKLQETHQTEKPLGIANKNFFLPMKEISILSELMKEQDVIVLFNQLISGGVIRGVRIMATNQHQKYDSICKVVLNKPLENHVFDAVTNPLGLLKDSIKKEFVSEPWILEYKYNLDALIEDFEKGEKDEKDVKLVVCWEVGERWSQRYAMIPLLLKENLHHRLFHGVTHEARSQSTGSSAFYLIVLSELIDFLNNPEAAAAQQKTNYSGEI